MAGPQDSDDGTKLRPSGEADRTSRRFDGGASPDVHEFDITRQRLSASGDTLDPLDVLDGRATRIADVESREVPLDPGMCIRRRYVLERLIGSGGMGQVWKAKDLISERARDPNPFVALKLLNADFETDPQAFVALQRETKKAQELAHPNIITVFAFDTDDEGSGRAFMSMELLEGETLDCLINRHPAGLIRSEALPIIVGMARGLEYAHEKGIVHSDFKPGNVFITQPGVPKVLDFGIARAAKLARVERIEDSFDAGTLGGLTLAYASSDMIAEHEQHDPHPVDDVYALGLVVYELLSGSHPFRRFDASEAGLKGMKAARIRSLRRYEWHAIARALEFDSLKRWQDAGEFLRAFEGKSIAPLALGGLALALAVAASGFWYQAHTAAGPSVAFEALSAHDQAEFRKQMAAGDGEWRLVQQGARGEVNGALQSYAQAYALHPRNPDASAALKKSADYMVTQLRRESDLGKRLSKLKALQKALLEYSDYYNNYRPLTDAIREAGGSE